MKQILKDLKEDIDCGTIIGGFVTPPSTMGRSSGQKTNMQTLDSNYVLDQMDPMAIYQIFYPTASKYTCFPNTQNTFENTSCQAACLRI